jgi:3-hydroxyisobutyrate dehydrogenase-like beta-hydroxyacid dehydrogenase
MNANAPLGFVGVGNMGAAMAARVLQQGGAVVAHDPSAAAARAIADLGAELAPTPAAVAERCSLVSVVVNTDDQARAAIAGSGGVLVGAAAGTVVAVHSTIHVATLEELAALAAERSVTIVDAAVTGGPDAARRGELAVMLGGPEEAVERIRPAIGHYGSLVIRVGELGAGMAAKISLMVVSFGKLAAAYEGLLLARAAGVDLAEFAAIVRHSEAQSGMHGFFIGERGLLFDGGGTLGAIGPHESPKSQKDLHAALELARRHGVELPLVALAHDEMPAVWGVAG